MRALWINGLCIAAGVFVGLGVSEFIGISEEPAATPPTSLKNMSADLWKSACGSAEPYRALSDLEPYDGRAADLTRIDVLPTSINPTVIGDRAILCNVEVQIVLVGENGPIQERSGVKKIWLMDAFSNTAVVVDEQTAKWVSDSPIVAALASFPEPLADPISN